MSDTNTLLTNTPDVCASGKVCFKCKTYKEAFDFYRDPRGSKGLYAWCRACQHTYKKTREKAHPEKAQQYLGRGRYNIDFNAMWAVQQGLCALCSEPMLPRGLHYNSVVVDHNHNLSCGCTGYKSCGECVRGLLHRRCNLLLGCVKDSTVLITQLIQHLHNPTLPILLGQIPEKAAPVTWGVGARVPTLCTEDIKACSKCRVVQDASAFYFAPKLKSGLSSWCRGCFTDYHVACEVARPDKLRGKQFGIDFNTMWTTQRGACAVCNDQMDPKGKGSLSVAVDHDHRCCPAKRSCGKCVRGLVHSHCNHALGLAGDSAPLLEKALVYLLRHTENLSQ